MIEDRRNLLQVLKQDRLNHVKQEDILIQEVGICKHRNHALREQNKDLEQQVQIVSEKIIEKSDEYQNVLSDLEHSLDKE